MDSCQRRGSFFLRVEPILKVFAGAISYLGIAVMMLVGGLLAMLYATAQEPVDTPPFANTLTEA